MLVLMMIGAIMILFGVYDYKRPDSKLLRFMKRAPETEHDRRNIRYGGESGIFGGVLFVVIGFIVILFKQFSG